MLMMKIKTIWIFMKTLKNTLTLGEIKDYETKLSRMNAHIEFI